MIDSVSLSGFEWLFLAMGLEQIEFGECFTAKESNYLR